MKRKATAQLQKAPATTALAKKAAPGKPQLRGAAKPAAKAASKPQARTQIKAPVKQVQQESDDDDDDDESASSGEDIGDIDEYLKGEDEEVATNNVVFDYDDGEVSFNPKKKYALGDFFIYLKKCYY